MDEARIKEYLGKKIFLAVKGGFKYTGEIVCVYDDCFSFVDKFSSKILVSFDDVAMIAEITKEDGEDKDVD